MTSRAKLSVRLLGWSAVAFAAFVTLFIWVGNNLERLLNRVIDTPLPPVAATTAALHNKSIVADLHCDSLLFGRDLLQHSTVGHIDLPRLQIGGVNIQIFAAATQIPIGFNINRTSNRLPDILTLAGYAQRSGMARLTPFERALRHAATLHTAADQSRGQLHLIRNRTELDAFISAWHDDPTLVAALLALEGVYPLDPDPQRLAALVAAGYRIFGLTHFRDNSFAASAHGTDQGGLTSRGRDFVQRCNELSLLLDLAHLSPQGIDDVLRLTTRPVIWSHGGVKGIVHNARNLGDDHIRAIAAQNGLVGIGYWRTAVGGRSPRHVAESILYVVELVGPDYVVLGSDFDGAIRTGFDTTALPAITQELVNAGVDDDAIRKIIGGNVVRLLQTALPVSDY
ncbi:MAG: membrane dipeptidase [Anaerolineae bacterium]|nr:membrane dipeptidase [Anaerolineae bacterium]